MFVISANFLPIVPEKQLMEKLKLEEKNFKREIIDISFILDERKVLMVSFIVNRIPSTFFKQRSFKHVRLHGPFKFIDF